MWTSSSSSYSDGNTSQKGRNHMVLGIEREERSRLYFLVSCILPIKGSVWLNDLGRGGDPFPEGSPSFLVCEKEKERLLEQKTE